MRLMESLARIVMVAVLALQGVAALAEEGVTKTSIVIGQSVALTGPGSSLAVPFHQGAKMYFENTYERRARAVHPAANIVALNADGNQVACREDGFWIDGHLGL